MKAYNSPQDELRIETNEGESLVHITKEEAVINNIKSNTLPEFPSYSAEDAGKTFVVNDSGELEMGSGGTTVVANPTLAGTEADLTGLQVGDVKYAIPQPVDNVFIVNFTRAQQLPEGYMLTADKSLNDISVAINNGKIVYGICGERTYILAYHQVVGISVDIRFVYVTENNGNAVYSTITTYMGVAFIEYTEKALNSGRVYLMNVDNNVIMNDVKAAYLAGKTLIAYKDYTDNSVSGRVYYPCVMVSYDATSDTLYWAVFANATINCGVTLGQWENYGTPSEVPIPMIYSLGSGSFTSYPHLPFLPKPSMCQGQSVLISQIDSYGGSPKFAWEYETKGMPVCPVSTDGTFVLKATVADGSVTYSWVAET